MWIQSLGQEDPLEEGMAAHSSIIAWRIPWSEEPGGPQSLASQRVGRKKVETTSQLGFVCCEAGKDVNGIVNIGTHSRKLPLSILMPLPTKR